MQQNETRETINFGTLKEGVNSYRTKAGITFHSTISAGRAVSLSAVDASGKDVPITVTTDARPQLPGICVVCTQAEPPKCFLMPCKGVPLSGTSKL